MISGFVLTWEGLAFVEESSLLEMQESGGIINNDGCEKWQRYSARQRCQALVLSTTISSSRTSSRKVQ